MAYDGVEMVPSSIPVVILHVRPTVVTVVNLQEAGDMFVVGLAVMVLRCMVLGWMRMVLRVMGMVTTDLEQQSSKHLGIINKRSTWIVNCILLIGL